MGVSSGPRTRSADVVVVGAGLSGLAAARRVADAGRSVVVLEARPDRVGGRVESRLCDGHAVDLGGSWIGADHRRATALVQEFGCTLWRTHSAGEAVVVDSGRRSLDQRYKWRHVLATLEGRRAVRTLDGLCAGISVEEPWESADAGRLDSQTLDSWIGGAVRGARARNTLRGTLANVFATEPAAISLLHALFYLRSNGGLGALLASEGGAQQDLVVGGAHAVADGLAARLGDAVELGAPVRSIEHGNSHVRVESDTLSVEAGAAVIAVAPALAGRIAYSPDLPLERDKLTQAVPNGDVIKIVALYDEAFWRREGLNGEAWGPDLPFSFSHDVSPPEGSPGAIALFCVADRARALRAVPPDRRRETVCRALELAFGERAARPSAIVERDWSAEPWSRGAYSGFMPPGVWTRYGRALREPVGRIAWGGTETAIEHHGFMEGALAAGERAADASLAQLS